MFPPGYDNTWLEFWASAFRICVSDVWSGRPGPLVLPFGTRNETGDVSQNSRSFGKASATSLNKHENAQSPSAHSDMFTQSVMAHIPPVDVDSIPSMRLIANLAHIELADNRHPRVPTSIKLSALSQYISGYDKTAAAMLEGFTHGFPLHYDGPQRLRFTQYHCSTLQDATVVDVKLLKEIGWGRMAGPFKKPFHDFQASPLDLIPKHEPDKFRLIRDLSFPRADSINCYTVRELTAVQYETLDRVIELVKPYGHDGHPRRFHVNSHQATGLPLVGDHVEEPVLPRQISSYGFLR